MKVLISNILSFVDKSHFAKTLSFLLTTNSCDRICSLPNISSLIYFIKGFIFSFIISVTLLISSTLFLSSLFNAVIVPSLLNRIVIS